MDFIAIGRIVKPVGTRGEVKILPLTDDQQRFHILSKVWIGRNTSDVEEKKILMSRIDARWVVLHLQGVETVEESERLKDAFVYVPADDAVQLQKGSYFIHEVIGCSVVTEEDVSIGVITDLLSLPSNDIWVVKKGTKEILLPAVKAIIRQVDIEQKRITIHALDGLLD
jgi:16S rRNA processing protein RimM